MQVLKEAGLTEGEIKVYLALLDIGLSTAGPIIKKSGVAKSIVYQILDKLMKKGLASYVVKDKTKYFQGADPDKIIEYLKEKEEGLKITIEKAKELIPQLELKQKLSEKSEATIYFGYKGIRTAHEHFYKKLKKGEEYCYLGTPAYQPPEMHMYWKRDHVRRIKTGIKCKMLFEADTDPKILKQRNSYKGAETRFMSAKIKTPACFMIYANTTVIILQSPVAIAVEIVNQEIKDSFQAYFEEFWKRSKPLQ